MKKSLNIFFIAFILLLIISCKSSQGPRENDINDNNVGEEAVINLGDRIGKYKGQYKDTQNNTVVLTLSIKSDTACIKFEVGTSSDVLITNISSNDTNNSIIFEEKKTLSYMGHKVTFISLENANYIRTNKPGNYPYSATLIKIPEN